MAKRTWFTFLAVVVVTASGASVALSQSGTWDDMPVKQGAGPSLVVVALKTVATLPMMGGGSIAFIDAGGGQIALGERGLRTARPVTVPMIVRYRATPLEIFTAGAPRGTRVPDALRLDHYAYQRRSGWPLSPPRDLTAEFAMLSLDDPGLEPFDCDGGGNNWHAGWSDTFNGVTDVHKSAFTHQAWLTPFYTFYPGGYYNPNNTITPGFNRVTYLGACNGDDDTPFTLQIHRRINYGTTPQGPMWVWTDVDEVILNGQEKYTFHSNIPGSFRGRMSSDTHVEHLGWGVAYDKGVPIGIGS